MQDHTELVASSRAETLIQVYLTPSPVLCPGELKVNVISARVKEQGQKSRRFNEEGVEITVQAVGSKYSDHISIMR